MTIYLYAIIAFDLFALGVLLGQHLERKKK